MTDQDPGGAPIPLRRDHPLPLWAQLSEELQRRIASLELQDSFPTELELSRAYRVSRHTVREALRSLRAKGLVTSRRGLGSTVTAPRFHQPLGALYSLFRFVEAQGARQHSEVLRLQPTSDPLVASRLGLPAGAGLIYLKRLRLADSVPLALDRAWVPAALGWPLLQADFTHSALYDQMAELCGVRPDSGTEEIRAVVPTPEERSSLSLRVGTPAFRIERLGRAGLDPVEWRSTLIRADRYSFRLDWVGPGEVSVDAQVRARSGEDPAGSR